MKDLFVSELCDLYGALLTDKQRAMLKDYYDLDYSLQEIADNACISRQAVHISIKQAKDALYECERKLGFSNKMNLLTKKLKEINDLPQENDIRGELKELIQSLRSYYGTV